MPQLKPIYLVSLRQQGDLGHEVLGLALREQRGGISDSLEQRQQPRRDHP